MFTCLCLTRVPPLSRAIKDTNHVSDDRVGEVGVLQVCEKFQSRLSHHDAGFSEGLDLRTGQEQGATRQHTAALPSISDWHQRPFLLAPAEANHHYASVHHNLFAAARCNHLGSTHTNVL